jgi:uncharacterized protein YegP (UPF0339 family)
MKAVLFRGKNDDWYFRIIADNGEQLAMSEGYRRKIDAQKTAEQFVDEIEVEVVEDA